MESAENEIKNEINQKLTKVQQLLNLNSAQTKKHDNIGENFIYYGLPGCGKSYYVQKEYLSNIDMYFYERITFHPEYSYEDFVGQIMPIIKDDKIQYEFVQGPFTRIVTKALMSPEKTFFLIIEEINRGNAPAIFGDIFQLLDRVKDSEDLLEKNLIGRSEYIVNNEIIEKSINKKLEESNNSDKKIKGIFIPHNLYIIGTMNTSDQNLFTLDTAFKRRFKFIKIRNNIEECKFRDYYIPTLGQTTTWKDFVDVINNKLISNLSDSIVNCEDKMLGIYFVDSNSLIKSFENMSSDNISKKSEYFASKILMYLWNDVFKYDRDSIFNYRTLDEVIYNFIKIGIKVFKNSDNLFDEDK